MKTVLLLFMLCVPLPLMATPLNFINLPAQPPETPSLILNASLARSGQDLLFSLTLTHAINFSTVDSFGRPAESFQWFLAGRNALRPMNSSEVLYVMRGDELHMDGEVTVCTAHPFGSGCPGGWGLELADTQMSWNSATRVFTFRVPLALLDGSNYSYDVISLEYGAESDWLSGATGSGNAVRMDHKVLPESSPAVLLTFGLAGILILWNFKRASFLALPAHSVGYSWRHGKRTL